MEYENFLKECWLFGELDDETIRKIVNASTTLSLASGELLFSKDDEADAVYFVVDGEIEIHIVSEDGRGVHIATKRGGSMFGELAVLDRGQRTAGASATKDTKLLRTGANIICKLTETDGKFSAAIIQDLVMKLRETSAQIEDISFRSLKARLASLILELAIPQIKQKPVIEMTQAKLAERLSATRENVNLHLQTIQRIGAIEIHRGKIEIKNLKLLEEFARTF